jgi:energy-coupling factor transport system permease protein
MINIKKINFSYLDVRVKIGITVFLSLILSFSKNLRARGTIFAFVLLCLLLSKSDFKSMIKKMRHLFIFLLFSSIFNFFYTNGRVLLKIGPVAITDKMLRLTVFTLLSMFTLTFIALILISTTEPDDISKAVSLMTKPLCIFGIDKNEISMIIILVFRFIPIIFSEIEKITLAQKARGASINSGNFLKRMKNLTSMLVPVFSACFQRAANTALAMEARCYGVNLERTNLKEFKIKKHDYFAIIIIILFSILVIYLNYTAD